jgi:hypothetical protein
LLLALICNLETAFGAFKTKKIDRFDTKEGFLELEEDIVLDTSANDKYDLIIEVRIVIDEGEKIVNDNNNPVKKIHKDGYHGLVECLLT